MELTKDHLICKERHSNKVYLITGSTLGIGYSILKRLALEGATVILSSRNKENCFNAERELNKLNVKYDTVICNFNNKEDRSKVFKLIDEKYGRLDGLVTNVAVSPHFGDTLSINEEQFKKIFETNVMSTFFTIKEAFPLLCKGQNASVLIISSLAGYTPFPKIGIYSISKTTLLSMTKLLAAEFAKHKIRVNGIAPGIIRTKFASAIADSAEAKLNFMRRVGHPDEISGLAAFLLSEDASFITAETVVACGGSYARL